MKLKILVGLIILSFILFSGVAQALTWTQTTQEDFQAGTLANIDSTTEAGSLKIDPAGPQVTISASKDASSVKLTWSAWGSEVGYNIYRSTTHEFTPSAANKIASVTETEYIDAGALDATAQDYYYLVMPINAQGLELAKSNMGFKLNYHLVENPALTDKSWVSFPYYKEYTNASDFTDEYGPSGVSVYAVTKRNPDQTYIGRVWIGAFWSGNFTMSKGEMFEISASPEADVVLVGSHDPSYAVTLIYNEGATTDKSWRSIPYNAKYTKASELFNDIPNCSLITRRLPDQSYESWDGSSGTDFDIVPGEGYEISVDTDTSWTPATNTLGIYASQTLDAGWAANWGTLTWTASAPAGTDMKFQIATNNDTSTWDFLGPDGTNSSFYETSGQAISSTQDNTRYLKLKAFLETQDHGVGSTSPTLEEISISYVSNSSVQFDKESYLIGVDDIYVTVTDPDEGAQSSVKATVECASTGDSETLTLDKINGTYRNTTALTSVLSSTGTSGNGILEVTAGSTIEVSYIDDDDPLDTSSDTAIMNVGNPPQVSNFLIDGRIRPTGDIISSTPLIQATVTDDTGIARISIMVNGVENKKYEHTPPRPTSPSISYEITPALELSPPTYTIKIEAQDESGNIAYSDEYTGLQVLPSPVVVVERPPVAYPTLFSPTQGQETKIAYTLSVDAEVTIYMYDITGRLVWKKAYPAGTEGGEAGYNEILWNGITDFGEVAPNGMYVYKLVSGNRVIERGTGKVVVLD